MPPCSGPGRFERQDHPTPVLVARQELTGADRQWANRYEPGGRRALQQASTLGVAGGDYALVTRVGPNENLLRVRLENGSALNYDPRRLQGVTVYRERERAFAVGDRVQFTAPVRELGVANRELGTIVAIERSGAMRLAMDSGGTTVVPAGPHRHLDYGYAVTSHSSQGQTADRVLVHVGHREC